MFTDQMRLSPFLVAALLVAAPGCTPAPEAPQTPAQVRVLSSNGVKSVIEALQPEIERAIGHALSIELSTASSLKTKIEAGEAFDVAILTPALIDDLVAQGKVSADSRVDVARAGVGIGARTIGSISGLPMLTEWPFCDAAPDTAPTGRSTPCPLWWGWMEKKTNPFLLCSELAAFLHLKNEWPIFKKRHGLK